MIAQHRLETRRRGESFDSFGVSLLFVCAKADLQLHVHSAARGFGAIGGARRHPQVIRIQRDGRMRCSAEVDDGLGLGRRRGSPGEEGDSSDGEYEKASPEDRKSHFSDYPGEMALSQGGT